MGKTISRFVVAVAVLYALGATAFAFAHYEGEKPDVPTILGDWNGWLGSLFATRHGPAQPGPEPASTPSPAPPAPGPTPGGEEAPGEAAPEASAPGAPPGMKLPPEGLAGEALELWKIEYQVLPAARKKAHALREMSREDSALFEQARTEILASLSETRPTLNAILERDSSHRQANRLWSAMQEIYQAVKKL